MTYAPQQGDIGLVRIHGAVGAGIRFAQWLNGDGFADFEHAFVYVGGGQLVEAEPGGARLAALAEYASERVVWLRAPLSCGPAVAEAARQLTGVPYSFLDYEAIALHHFHIWAPGLKRYIGSTGHMICSQLADEAARRGGWKIFDDGRWPGYVTPGDLYREALKQA